MYVYIAVIAMILAVMLQLVNGVAALKFNGYGLESLQEGHF